MRPNEQNIPERRDPHRGGRFELFFFEQVGTRHYLRFTRLALILIASLTVAAVALLFALYLSRGRGGSKNTNVEIVSPPHTPHDYNRPMIRPAPSPPTPPRVRQREISMPTPQAPRGAAENGNSPSTPSPTQSPMPARTPT